MASNKGMIYLIQPAELVGTSRFKIGCSKVPNLDKCYYKYKDGSRYLYIAECFDPYFLEKKIEDIFNEKFTLVAGREFFEGDEIEIINTFIEICRAHDDEYYDNAICINECIKYNNKKNEEKNINLNITDSSQIINNNILIGFGKEDIQKIVSNDQYIKIIMYGIDSVIELFRFIHFNKNIKIYNNCFKHNMKDHYCNIYNGEKWVKIDDNEIIDEIINRNIKFLSNKYEEFIYLDRINKNKILTEYAKSQFSKLIIAKRKNENNLKEYLSDKIKDIMYNDRDISQQTIREINEYNNQQKN